MEGGCYFLSADLRGSLIQEGEEGQATRDWVVWILRDAVRWSEGACLVKGLLLMTLTRHIHTLSFGLINKVH